MTEVIGKSKKEERSDENQNSQSDDFLRSCFIDLDGSGNQNNPRSMWLRLHGNLQ